MCDRENSTPLKRGSRLLALMLAAIGLLCGSSASAQFLDAFPGNTLNTDPYLDNVGSVPGATVALTRQAGETAHAGNAGNASAWASWTAPSTGSYTFSLTADFDSILAVYTGGAVNGVVLVPGGAANNPGTSNESVTFNAVQGTTYRFVVDGAGNGTVGAQGFFILTWSGPPANDNAGGARLLPSATSGSVTGNNIQSTGEAGEFNHATVSIPNTSVWYRWTAPTTAIVSFNTVGSGFDSTLAAYRLNTMPVLFGNMTLMAENDDIDIGAGILDARISFLAVAGTTYFVAVAGYLGDTGSVLLSWNAPPSNDFFVNSANLGGGFSGLVNGSNLSATSEVGEPQHSNVGGASIWYHWTAPASGTVIFTTAGSNFDTLLGVYTGTSVDALSVVAQDDDSGGGLASKVSFTATAGVTYRIAVDGFGGIPPVSTGSVTLSWLYASSAGQFRFTTGNFNAKESESAIGTVLDQFGAYVTITRENGFLGRVLVDLTFTDLTAVGGTDYGYISGTTITLGFDDFQMSTNILVPIIDNALSGALTKQFRMTLSNPRPDPVANPVTGYLEDPTLQPQLASANTIATVTIEEDDLTAPRFRRERYFTSEGSNRNIQVIRNVAAPATGAFIRINSADPGQVPDNNTFVLMAGSDYAEPDDGGLDPDFTAFGGAFTSAAVTWGDGQTGNRNIQFTTLQDTLVEFNEDVFLSLHSTATGNPQLDTSYMTILFDFADGGEQAPGAVDRDYNRDRDSRTSPPHNSTPGANGPVFAVAVQSDDRTVMAGDFTAYNTINRFRIARANFDGSIDTSFNPGGGPDGFVSSLALQSDQKIIVGGGFFSFNGVPHQGVTRLNTDGSVDNTFNPGTGASGPVRAVGIYPATAGADAGKIIVAGEFTGYNGTNINYIARLRTDGTLDAPNFGVGTGPNGPVYAVSISSNGKIAIGGDFTEVNGVSRPGVARLNADGSLDTAFNPGAGANNTVNAVLFQPDGKLLVAGAFTQMDLNTSARIARLNANGTFDTTFYTSTGFDDSVFTLALQPDGRILAGGIFTHYHGVRRVGLTRIFSNGNLDTSFMDPAYNQFAGVINRLSTEPKNFISSVGVQSDGNVMIGGTFTRLGGGYRREDIRVRYNVARIIGGAIEGPGNMEFPFSTYTVDENSGSLFITVNRNNGSLGAAAVSFNTSDRAAGPGAAQAGVDYQSTIATPIWASGRNVAALGIPRRVTEGIMGANNDAFMGPPQGPLIRVTTPFDDVRVTIFDNANVEGDRVLNLNLSRSTDVEIIALGGESIPFGVALGRDQATLTIVNNDFNHGVLGLTSAEYSVTENGGVANITITRTNGTTGTVSIDYFTSNGTATGGASSAPNVDYLSRSGRLTLPSGVTSASFTIPIINDSLAEPDETLTITLHNPAGGATTNATLYPVAATLTILDNDFSHGRLSISPTTYNVTEAGATAVINVVRTGGNVGALSVKYDSINGTATGGAAAGVGVDYQTVSGTLTWNDGDTSVRTITVPIFVDGEVEPPIETFTVVLSDPRILATGGTDPLLLGNTVGTVNIQDSDNAGTLQLVASAFSITENGGEAIITVERLNGTSGNVFFEYATVNTSGARPVFRVDTATDIDGGTDFITVTNHGLANDSILRVVSADPFGNLTPGVNYFVVNSTQNTFQLSTTLGGVPLDLAPSGSVGDTGDLKLIVGFDSNTGIAGSAILLPGNPYSNGDQVVFDNVPGTVGLTSGITYFVVNRTANSFQVSLTSGGSVVAINSSGMANVYIGINSDESGYVHSAGTVTLAGGISSGQFRVPIIDNFVQNRLLAGSFNRLFDVDIPLIINAANGTPLTATVTIVDDEFVNEPAGSVDSAYNALAGANGFVYALRLQADGNLLIGGDFTTFNGVNRVRLARLFTNGDLDPSLTVGTGADDSIRAIEVQDDNKIIIGGFFTNYNGTNRSRIARLNFDGSIDLGFNPGAGADNPVYDIEIHRDAQNRGKVLVAGAFSKFNGQTRPHLVRLNTNGAIDTLFQIGSGFDGDVHTVAIQADGKIVVGGDFLTYNGQSVGRVARLLPNGTLDAAFRPQFDGSVRSLLVQGDGRILVGGFFTNATPSGSSIAQPFNYLARLETDGTLDPAFTPGAGGDRPVLTLALQPDGKILVGGDFLKFSDVTRRRLTRLNGDGTADVAINFGEGANSFITALEIQPTDGKIIAGGGFTLFDSQPRNYLTRLHGGVIAGPGRLQFSLPLYTVSESETNAVIQVRRTGGTAGSVSVDLRTADILPAGAGRANSTDYTALVTNLVFPAAETFLEVRITINNDVEIEGDELLDLILENPSTSAPYGLGNQPVAQLRIVDNDSSVFFTQTLFSVNESDLTGAAQVQLVRTGGISGTISVRLTTTDGTATAGSDYGAVSTVVTFLPGETNKTVAVSLINDAIDEGNESLTLNLAYVGGDGIIGSPGQATLVILNDDFAPGVVQFVQAGYTVDENGGFVTLAVVRTNGSSGLITVNFATVSTGDALGGVSAGVGVDFIHTNGSLAFADGEKLKFINVPITPDADAIETNETFQVQLSAATGGAVIGFPNPATVTIVNNNSAIYGQFSIDPIAPIMESGVTPITVNLTGRTTNEPVSVDFTVVGVSAISGADFVATNGTVVFTNIGDTTRTFDLTILPDDLVETNETLQIILSNPLIATVPTRGNGPSIATPTTTVTIVSTNELPGTIVFRQPVFTASESGTNIMIVLERTNGVTGPVSVDVTLANGTALLGADYQDFVGAPLIVVWPDAVGGAITNFIPLINDTIVEADETILVSLSNPTGGAIFATNGTTTLTNAVAVIIDDEVKAGSVDESFAPTTDGPVYDLAIWPGTNRISVVGDFTAVNSISRANVAQLNLDGTLFTGFNAGAVTLGGSNATIRTVVASTNGTHVGKIVIGGRFDSVNGVPVRNLARLNIDGTVDTSFAIGTGPNAPVNVVQLQADGKLIIGGDFNTVGVSAANFLARLNTDGSVDGTFAIGSGGDAPVNALVLLDNGDVIVGGDFSLFNGTPSSRLARLTTTGGLVGTFSANLAGGFNNSVFALAQQQNGDILVGGAFTQVGTNAYNYLVRLNSDGTVDTGFTGFGIGFNDSVFSLVVQPDQKILAAGNFTSFNNVPHNRIVRLLSTGAIDPTINFGTGADGFINTMILQPDNKILIGGGFQVFNGQLRHNLARLNNGTNSGSGVFQFIAGQFPVNENGSSVAVTVLRILGTALSTSVDVVTLPGTAQPGVDYAPSTNTLIFAEGETVKQVLLPVFDDVPPATNVNKFFYVQLLNPTNNVGVAPVRDLTLVAALTNATVVVVDNESVISFDSASYVVAENGVNATITLTRTGGSNDPVTVRLETTIGSATESIDYLAVTNDIVWGAGDNLPKTILIPISNDTLVEGIETIGLQLTNFVGSALPGVTNAVLNIMDDDFSSGVITFELSNYPVTESLPAQIVVLRTNGSSGIVSVNLATVNGTALAGADYTATNVLVTFANGETRKVINITTLDDALQDDGETFTINLSNPTGGAVLGTASATATIEDNDVTIGFAAASVNVTETDTTLDLTVTRTGLDTRTFIVDYATANLTAEAGLDYNQTNGVIVFGPGEISKIITVQVKEDFIIEGPESFRVLLSGTNLSLLGQTQTAINIDDNDISTDLEVIVRVNNPVKTNTTVIYTLLVTNYGPSDISGVTLTNILPSTLQLTSVSVTNVTTNGNTLIFDLPVIPKAAGYLVEIQALDTNGIIRSVTNISTVGLPSPTNDVNLANNSVTNVTGLRGPGPYLAIDSLNILTETPGPANGAFDINEQATVSVTFRNLGDVSSTAAAVTLQGTGGALTNTGPQNATLGAIAPNGTVSRNFTFTTTGTNGGLLTLTFALTDTGGITYDPGILNYRLGGSVRTGSTNQITINPIGDATPYPDTLNVVGMVGIIDQVALTISNLSHTFPADIDMLLVSPTGQGVIVMSDAGQGFQLTGASFTISDLASTALPQSARINNGVSYRPADYDVTGDSDDFGIAAPAGPHFSTMAAFRGSDPNGIWRLYVRDDTTGDFGVISNGWSLNITTVFPANPSANLVIAGTQTAGPLLVGADQTYTLLVTNRGPATVNSVFVTNTFSAAFTVIGASNSAGGAVTTPAGRVVLALGTMTNGQVITNYVTVRPSTAGTFTNVASVGIASTETDPFLGDNTLVFSQIIGANADLAVGVTTSPVGTVALGNTLTYSISLTNLGPSTATGVIITNVLPAGVNYVSGSASQGVISRSGSIVTATLGSVGTGGTAQVSIVVTPTSAGSLTNTVTAVSSVTDGNPLNNVAVTTTTAVTDSADLQISLVGTPDPVTLGNNITYSISLTNRGPSTATGVVVTNPVPGSVTLVSFTPAQGTAANVSGAVVFTVGSVPTGTNLVMQVVVTANNAGAVNSTAIVTASGTFDPVSANNSATIATAVQSPSADIDLGASTLLAESASPANGAIDPAETVTVRLELVNKGALATANLVATLLPTGGVVTNSPQVQTYGAIAPGAGVARDYTFTANGNLGDTLSVTLQLQDGAVNMGTVTFTFQLGESERVISTALISGVDNGAALTYPSIITVSGVSGTILKATVTLSNVIHTFPDDFDLLLVSPTGKKVKLVSDVGGGFALSGVNITLDDNASAPLPDSGAITDGVYKPSDYLNSPVDSTSTNDTFAAPAPAGPYATTLAELVGTNPNGQWSLYVMDDQNGNVGSIGGWSLSIVTVATLTPSADVRVLVTASPEPVTVRSNLTYTITVTNSGPNAVSGVVLSNAVPADARVVSLATAQGSIVTNGAGAVIWTVGSIAANGQYQAAIVVAPDLPGSVTNVATVTHTDLELNPSNNSVTTISTVSGVALSGGSINVTPTNVSLTLIGQPGVTYIVEASSDLVNWVQISTQSSADGVIVINDPAGAGSELRFYRARQQ